MKHLLHALGLAAVLSICLSGCHTLVVVPRADAPVATSAEKPDPGGREGSYFFGIFAVQSHAVSVSCGRVPAEVHIETGVWDSLIHFFIGPVYTTKTVEVYCKK